MATLKISIPIASDWPTPEELAGRDAIEAALGASHMGQCNDAGGGLGQMNLSYHVDDDSQIAAARARIDDIVDQHMPGFVCNITVLTEPSRTFQIQVGDIFAIPLAERQYAIGLCIFVFQKYEGFAAFRIFDDILTDAKLVEPLPAAAAFDPLFAWDHSLAAGSWPIIGSTHVETAPLMYRSAGGIYDRDEYLGPTDYTEDVPNLTLPGPVAVEIQLRKHFGLPLADDSGG